MSLKWLIYGKGWIAEHFIKILSELRPEDKVTFGVSRADNPETLQTELLELKPDRVVSLIGRTHGPGFSTIDYLEQKGKLVENVRDNLFAPVVLALLCSKLNIHLTYLGTGCIFTTENKESFTESDVPNFFGSSYSVVKGFTDRLYHLFPEALNVRIRMPITAEKHPRNFITKITTYAKICSVPNSMSVLPTLLPIMIQMAVQKVSGTYNLCNPGTITHNRILELYKEIVDPQFTWSNFTIEEQNKILAAGRSNNELDSSKLLSYTDVPDIETAVIGVLQEMAKK
jgi:3,5-epimerase/4-reductase